MAIFEKLEIHVLIKIYNLWIKIRNFWVPKETPNPHYSPYKYEVNWIKIHEMRAKRLSPVIFSPTVGQNLVQILNFSMV